MIFRVKPLHFIPSRSIVFTGNARKLGDPDVVELPNLAANLFRQLDQVVVLLMVQFHFQVQVGSHSRSTLEADGVGQVKTGVVVFGHGSSVPSANAAVERVASESARAGGFALCETAFLDVAPTLRDATIRLIAQGAQEILVVPYFLTLGIHLQRDLPRMVDELEREFPGLAMRVTPPLDGHPALHAIVVDRAREAMSV